MAGPRGLPDHVWYAAYGSNVDATRFGVYLTGGRAPRARRDQPGARDGSAPLADAPCHLVYPLRFGGVSKTWGGGGVAFVDVEPAGPTTLARRYLVTREQFEDVLAQESGAAVGRTIDLAGPIDGRAATVGEGRYDHVLPCGTVDDVPVLTFTMAPDQRPAANPPSAAYAATIASGLIAAHGLTPSAAAAYLDAAADASVGS